MSHILDVKSIELRSILGFVELIIELKKINSPYYSDFPIVIPSKIQNKQKLLDYFHDIIRYDYCPKSTNMSKTIFTKELMYLEQFEICIPNPNTIDQNTGFYTFTYRIPKKITRKPENKIILDEFINKSKLNCLTLEYTTENTNSPVCEMYLKEVSETLNTLIVDEENTTNNIDKENIVLKSSNEVFEELKAKIKYQVEQNHILERITSIQNDYINGVVNNCNLSISGSSKVKTQTDPIKSIDTKGIDFITIESEEENVYRKNGSVERVNQYLVSNFFRQQNTNIYNTKLDYEKQTFKDIGNSPLAYERILNKIIDPLLMTNKRVLKISKDKTTMTLLGNPTSDDIVSYLNTLIKENTPHLSIEHTLNTYNEMDSYEIIEPVIYDKPVIESYYEEIEGIILPNQEGYNKSPDMLGIFFKNLDI